MKEIFGTPLNILFLASLGLAVASANTQERLLDDAAWRADITTVADAVQEFHPRPFRTTSAAEFQQHYDTLLGDVPELSDKEVIVRLAALVALIDDGHTRLSIPRQHPSIGLEFGHTPTPGPEHAQLEFSQLPLKFEKLDDGIFVIEARADLADLIGHQLVAIDDMAADDALAAVQAVTFAENTQLQALMGADRLTLPDALVALGVSDSDTEVTLTLAAPNGAEVRRTITPINSESLEWTDAFAGQPEQLRHKHPERKFWSEYVSDGNFVYMQMDEIADDDISMAEFVTATLQTVIEHDARLIIDIRNNFGGSGGINKTLVMSIIQNNELNQYERTFVLTGRRTFSAAQMLVNEFEQYTRVTFVGEPTGSRPDHYGDPKKIRLEHSGLTLRVSRLHWSSYTAFDNREATHPDFLVGWTSDAYFAGRDPALDVALSLSDIQMKQLVRTAILRRDMVQVGRYLLDAKRAPDTYAQEFRDMLLELGIEFEQEGERDAASFAYQVGLYFYPESEQLTAALTTLNSSS